MFHDHDLHKNKNYYLDKVICNLKIKDTYYFKTTCFMKLNLLKCQTKWNFSKDICIDRLDEKWHYHNICRVQRAELAVKYYSLRPKRELSGKQKTSTMTTSQATYGPQSAPTLSKNFFLNFYFYKIPTHSHSWFVEREFTFLNVFTSIYISPPVKTSVKKKKKKRTFTNIIKTSDKHAVLWHGKSCIDCNNNIDIFTTKIIIIIIRVGYFL